jgi:hypothetical protein
LSSQSPHRRLRLQRLSPFLSIFPVSYSLDPIPCFRLNFLFLVLLLFVRFITQRGKQGTPNKR